MNKIEALNDIVTGLGGTGGYKYEIQALNAWAVLVGAAGGYKYEIQALNAIDKALKVEQGFISTTLMR